MGGKTCVLHQDKLCVKYDVYHESLSDSMAEIFWLWGHRKRCQDNLLTN